jgi:hypothetical protein
VRHSVRVLALALLAAATVSFGAQRASAGLLDGGWGCGCGGYAYVQPYAAPQPYVAFETQTVVRPAYVVAPGYGYAVESMGGGYGGWGWHHRYYRHYGWHHHF